LARLLRQTRLVDIVGSTVSPDEAMRFLSKNVVAAVFLNIQMPGMTGFELLQKLPKEPGGRLHDGVRSVRARSL